MFCSILISTLQPRQLSNRDNLFQELSYNTRLTDFSSLLNYNSGGNQDHDIFVEVECSKSDLHVHPSWILRGYLQFFPSMNHTAIMFSGPDSPVPYKT